MKSKRTMFTRNKALLPFAVALAMAVVGAARAADYPTTILADHPLAYYRLEETSGTTAVDSSASGAYPGEYVQNGVYPILGLPGIDTNSIDLSAAESPDYVNVGYYSQLNQPGPFSFESGPGQPAFLPAGIIVVRLETHLPTELPLNPAGMFTRRLTCRASWLW